MKVSERDNIDNIAKNVTYYYNNLDDLLTYILFVELKGSFSTEGLQQLIDRIGDYLSLEDSKEWGRLTSGVVKL
jgi:hypothetical protein